MLKKPELLIPAGDLEKLQTAVRFGANAVYVGAGPYSLRANQTSFNIKELKEGIDFAHKNKVKVYLAMNIFPFDKDLPEMMKYLKKAVQAGIDAVIVSDPGLIALVRKYNKKIKIHLSTQANTINSEAVKFWRKQGAKRIVLGREVSLDQAKKIKQKNPHSEIELFIHGAMCISYSGRCLLSRQLTGRSANRGDCTQPCRWEYRLKEISRPDEEFLIQQNERGTYVMNSKDLCLIEHLPELFEAKIDSFKVEGRMKSAYYVALVTKIYRQAIEQYLQNPKKYKYNPDWKKELENVSHRNYTTGFYFGEQETENYGSDANIRNYTFVGVVKKHDLNKNELEIKARNYFAVGDELEIIDPLVAEIEKIKINKMKSIDNHEIKKAHNQYHLIAEINNCPQQISEFSLLRRKKSH